MTVSIFYADDPGSSVLDGRITNFQASETWTSIRDTTGSDQAGYYGFPINTGGGATFNIQVRQSTPANYWIILARAFFFFDTASLPDDETISAAALEVVVTSKTNVRYDSEITVTLMDTASTTALQFDDYSLDTFSTTHQSNDVNIDALTADSSTYNTLTLNAAGIGKVTKDGISTFGIMFVNDVDDVEPNWGGDPTGNSEIHFAGSNETLTGDKRPRLVVTHAIPFTSKVIMF